MNLQKMIDELIKERDHLDRAIAELEALQGLHPEDEHRRGRRWMAKEERLRVSERMRNYWKKRKAQ